MCLVIALVLFVKAVWEWLFPDERFMILFFFGLDEEYSYNYSRFRIYDIVLTVISSLTLVVFHFYRSYLLLIGMCVVLLVMVVLMYCITRKKKI